MKKIARIAAIILAIVLIMGIGVVTNSLVGNPVSKYLATNKFKDYIGEHYKELDLHVEDVSYNFKYGTYQGIAKSDTSIDTVFSLSYRGGKVEDTYEGDVLGRWNTYCRLNNEFDQEICAILGKELPYTSSILFGELKKPETINGEAVPLDLQYDSATVPFEKSITLYVEVQELSMEALADVVVEVDAMLTRNNQNMSWYTIVLEQEYNLLGVYNFPKELVGSKDLIDVLKDYVKR